MTIRLVDIIDVAADWETAHRVRALEVNGRSLAVAGLADMSKKHPEDYKKLLKAMKLVAGNRRVRNEQFVKESKEHKGIYEMRGGQARLFFFYTPEEQEVVVCTNEYYKAKSSKEEQNTAFGRCARLRDAYLSARGLRGRGG